jgi:hypothetical protein
MASPSFVPELVSGRRISLAQIDAAVSARLGPTRGFGNSQPACFNRQVAMYLAKQVGRWSTTIIGRFYNGRDHSTVCHGIQRIEALRESDPDVDALLSDLRNQLGVGATSTSVPADAQPGPAALTETTLAQLADLVAARVCAYLENRLQEGRADPAVR